MKYGRYLGHYTAEDVEGIAVGNPEPEIVKTPMTTKGLVLRLLFLALLFVTGLIFIWALAWGIRRALREPHDGSELVFFIGF